MTIHDAHEQALIDLRELTERMLELARRAEWTAVEEARPIRETLLRAAFAQPISPELAPRAAVEIRRTLAAEQALTDLALAERERAARDLRDLRGARRGVGHYQDVIRDSTA